MGLAEIRAALMLAIDGIVPSSASQHAFTRLDPTDPRAFEDIAVEAPRVYDLQRTGGNADTGLLSDGAAPEEVEFELLLTVGYPLAAFRGRDLAWEAMTQDEIALTGALRPVSVWTSDAADVAVSNDNDVSPVIGADGPVAFIVSIPIIVRYRP